MSWGFGNDNDDKKDNFHFSSVFTDSAKTSSSFGFEPVNSAFSSAGTDSAKGNSWYEPSKGLYGQGATGSSGGFYGNNQDNGFFSPVKNSGFGGSEQSSLFSQSQDSVFSVKDTAFGSSSKGSWGMGGSGFLNDHARNELHWANSKDTGHWANTAAQLERLDAWNALEDQHRSNCLLNKRSSFDTSFAYSAPKSSLSSSVFDTPKKTGASSDNYSPFTPSPLKKWGDGIV